MGSLNFCTILEVRGIDYFTFHIKINNNIAKELGRCNTMGVKKQLQYNGTVFTVKNTVPQMTTAERKLLLQTISDDLKASLNRLG